MVLKPACIYNISETLTYKKPGQKIFTKDATYPAQFATLKLVNKDITRIIYAGGIPDVMMEHVVLDGRRYHLSIRSKQETGGKTQLSLAFFGGAGGDNQIVRECIFMNVRSWSTLKVHEGASNVLIENNLIFGAGVDLRGNGRSLKESWPRYWGDGITFAARDSIVRNNFIMEPTDVGIVLFGSPGTIAENNVIASISRESLGGINLVDPIGHYKMNETETDYSGVKIRNNYIDALGARIHIGLPMGAPQWAPKNHGQFLVGCEVTGNIIAGNAAGYGYVAHTIKNWKITGNLSTATYSGLAEFGDHPDPPDDPSAFIYDSNTVIDSELQSDFVPAKLHIDHLLRTQFAPVDEHGYQMHDYGNAEVKAIVETAYLEMLGREVDPGGLKENVDRLLSKEMNADGLRRILMASTEFKIRYGYRPPEDLHTYRVQLWFNIYNAIIREDGKWLPAREMYTKALTALHMDNRETLQIDRVDESTLTVERLK
ncbi:MAG: right-handed parallel beta-helix repeat-containing protein [Candidatus Margulisbacteria bacterium]|nr:right-handed parallel beta-helix repeat-containing protein [Candidatus Margulisiibacteriota bacterium]